jgi:hypothetical protein
MLKPGPVKAAVEQFLADEEDKGTGSCEEIAFGIN